MARGIPVLVTLAVLGSSACSQPPPRLRVMSYNVNFGLAGDASGVRAIGRAHPDIVLLQETNHAWEQALVETLGRRYPYQRFVDPAGRPAGGMAILSRFPIRQLEELPTYGGYFVASRIVVDTNLGRLQLLDVHLRPPMSDGGSWVAGFFTTRGDRLREIEHHLAALDRDLPTVIAGDFNEESDGSAIQRCIASGYGDAIAQYGGTKRTWQWRLPSGMTLSFQLDHILHDPRLRAVAATIVEAGSSDHKPIWADLVRATSD